MTLFKALIPLLTELKNSGVLFPEIQRKSGISGSRLNAILTGRVRATSDELQGIIDVIP